MSGEVRRRKLFDLFSKNLAAAKQQWPQLPDVRDHFLCPLCREIFDRGALNPPERISIEHTIPSALGGTYKTATLVCTACNNRAGSTLDFHITNRLQAEEFFQGISAHPRRSTIKMGEFEVRADWLLRHAERHETDLRIDGKNSNPADVEGLKNEMRKALQDAGGTAFKLGFEMRFSMWKSHVALLRTAYLLAFRTFGYAYALNRCVRPVLDQIHRPKERLLPDAFCLDFTEPPVEDSEILFVKAPSEFRSLLAVLRLRTKRRTVYKGVILPGPSDMGGALYERMKENKATYGAFTGTFQRLVAEEIRLDDPAHLLTLHYLWQECCET